jgi:hypothetical protein
MRREEVSRLGAGGLASQWTGRELESVQSAVVCSAGSGNARRSGIWPHIHGWTTATSSAFAREVLSSVPATSIAIREGLPGVRQINEGEDTLCMYALYTLLKKGLVRCFSVSTKHSLGIVLESICLFIQRVLLYNLHLERDTILPMYRPGQTILSLRRSKWKRYQMFMIPTRIYSVMYFHTIPIWFNVININTVFYID